MLVKNKNSELEVTEFKLKRMAGGISCRMEKCIFLAQNTSMDS
jgi:hypothetical protein